MLENPELLNNQAVELAQNGSYTEAIACFMRAISIQKNNANLWYNLGVTYRDSGNAEHAKMAFLQALDIDPVDECTIEALSEICFQKSEFVEAMTYCWEGLDLNPFNSHLWNTLGAVNFNMENFEDASSAFEQALFLNPYYYDALYNLRDTYIELKNFAGAEVCQQKMKEIKR